MIVTSWHWIRPMIERDSEQCSAVPLIRVKLAYLRLPLRLNSMMGFLPHVINSKIASKGVMYNKASQSASHRVGQERYVNFWILRSSARRVSRVVDIRQRLIHWSRNSIAHAPGFVRIWCLWGRNLVHRFELQEWKRIMKSIPRAISINVKSRWKV
jgi:hypothetical protein